VEIYFDGPRHDGKTVLNCLKEYGVSVFWFNAVVMIMNLQSYSIKSKGRIY
jgi:hypothetical protein